MPYFNFISNPMIGRGWMHDVECAKKYNGAWQVDVTDVCRGAIHGMAETVPEDAKDLRINYSIYRIDHEDGRDIYWWSSANDRITNAAGIRPYFHPSREYNSQQHTLNWQLWRILPEKAYYTPMLDAWAELSPGLLDDEVELGAGLAKLVLASTVYYTSLFPAWNGGHSPTMYAGDMPSSMQRVVLSCDKPKSLYRSVVYLTALGAVELISAFNKGELDDEECLKYFGKRETNFRHQFSNAFTGHIMQRIMIPNHLTPRLAHKWGKEVAFVVPGGTGDEKVKANLVEFCRIVSLQEFPLISEETRNAAREVYERHTGKLAAN